LGYFIKFSLESFSSLKDLEETEAFFRDRDTSKYRLPLLQSCDAIRANIAWLEV
jgi:aminopeptidase 2